MSFTEIKVFGFRHVIIDSEDRGFYTSSKNKKGEKIPDANYRGTKKTLCGIKYNNATLEEWLKKTKKI